MIDDIIKGIGNFFLKPEAKKSEKTQGSNAKGSNSKSIEASQVMKKLFTKTDAFSQTEFPYQWDKDFFPPLHKDEREYIRKEILRWYSIYIEVSLSKIVDAVRTVLLKPSSKNEGVVLYFREFPEEFTLMIQDIIEEKIHSVITDKINTHNDTQLIKWKPTKGEDCWEPPMNEFGQILKQLSADAMTISEEQINKQKEEMVKLLQLQRSNLSEQDKIIGIANEIKTFLNKNKKELIKHCNDRLLLEWSSFPYYYGKMEKSFKNDIYEKYRLQFGCTTYNELFGKVFIPLNKFIQLHGKQELKKWLDEQWNEFVIFIVNDYKNRSIEEIYKLDPGEFNKYAFSIDFYAVMLFKISMDGM